MDRMWGRPGAGAPLGREHVDFAKKQKRKIPYFILGYSPSSFQPELVKTLRVAEWDVG